MAFFAWFPIRNCRTWPARSNRRHSPPASKSARIVGITMTYPPTPKTEGFLLAADAILADAYTLWLQAALRIDRGMIAETGPLATLAAAHPHLPLIRLTDHVLIPGLINAHTHLELSFARELIPPPRHFTDWVLQLVSLLPTEAQAEDKIPAATSSGAWECLASGVTTVGDISRFPALTRRTLAGLPLRTVSYGEITALGRSRDFLEQRLSSAADRRFQTPRLNIGLSPHAPYSVEGPALRRIVDAAIAGHMPLAMHLAELAEESHFLSSLGGRLGRDWDLMKRLNLLDDQIPLSSAGPVGWAAEWGLLKSHDTAQPALVLAHCNYLSDADILRIAAAGASVAFCPRTHYYFGHSTSGEHPWRRLQAAGVNVCLATDSLASNPDLTLLREAQWLLRGNPSIAPNPLLEMMTTAGAKALGLAGRAGCLHVGHYADILAFSPPAEACGGGAQSLAEWLVKTAPPPRKVWAAGEQVWSDSAG